METPRVHQPRPTRLVAVPYRWNDERRIRCFRIVDGELQPGECPKEHGLGDVVAAGTKAVGVQPCGGCLKRKEALNAATPGWVKRILGKLGKL